MALVYEARRESLAGVSPRVAIKLILPEYTDSDTFQELFINEARLGSSMHHQNLVQIQDFDQDGDRFFLVMEYVEGITLRRAISLCRRNRVHVPVGVIAEVGRQACDGLAYAHSAADESGEHLGLVHRDVKPSNLILNPQGVIKIVDFGISKGFRLVEKRGTVKGTWGYMAPEQANGQGVGPATDVFGLATVLYEMASKQPMFPDKTPDIVKRLLAEDHPVRMVAQLDPAYRVLVEPLTRALERNARNRYPDAAEFARALSALLPDPISARDEVVRFYGGVDALHKGLPVPEGTLANESPAISVADTNASSIPSAARPDSDNDSGPLLWVLAGVGGIVLVGAVVAVAAMLWLLPPTSVSSVGTSVEPLSLGDVVTTPRPELAPLRAVDEPAGPAGEGAPGEELPPPIAERTAPERLPPPMTIPARTDPVRLAPLNPVQVGPASDAVPVVGMPFVEEAPMERVVVVRRAPEPEVEILEPEQQAEVLEAPAPVATGPGFLTIGARQPAEVYIDGRYIRQVPLVRGELSSGSHLITIQALDGRKKVFEVDMEAGEELRKVWDFDRSEWRP
ncbi:MAG: serine/threonine-protein kinase [Myxococcota bacterium]|jgi:serine/threonine-protein kinase